MEGFVIENGVLQKYTGAAACVSVPDGITEIGEEAFLDCGEIREITVPASVRNVGDHAFMNAAGLSRIVFKGELPRLGKGIIYGLKDGVTVEIDGSSEDFILAHLPNGNHRAFFDRYDDFGEVLDYPEYLETVFDFINPFGTDYAPNNISYKVICHGDGRTVELTTFTEQILLRGSEHGLRCFSLPEVRVSGKGRLPDPDFLINNGEITAVGGEETPLPKELWGAVASELQDSCREGIEEASGYVLDIKLYVYEAGFHKPHGDFVLTYRPFGEDGEGLGGIVHRFIRKN